MLLITKFNETIKMESRKLKWKEFGKNKPECEKK